MCCGPQVSLSVVHASLKHGLPSIIKRLWHYTPAFENWNVYHVAAQYSPRTGLPLLLTLCVPLPTERRLSKFLNALAYSHSPEALLATIFCMGDYARNATFRQCVDRVPNLKRLTHNPAFTTEASLKALRLHKPVKLP